MSALDPQDVARPRKPGDLCPKCGRPVEVRAGMFYFRGRSFPGLVCCGALWCDESQETIFDAAREAGAS